MQIPSFPNKSLFNASYPSFPMYNIDILNYKFSVPNPAAIPQWIGELLIYSMEWILGWLGAIFLFAIQFCTAELYNTLTWLINFSFSEFDKMIAIGETVGKGSGVFAPVVTVAFLGLITLAFIGAAILLVNLAQKIV